MGFARGACIIGQKPVAAGGGEGVHEQDMIALLQQHDERGMDALLLHCGPLMRYIIAPIVPNALDREECLSEASPRAAAGARG